MSSPRRKPTIPPAAENARDPMLLPIMIFLMVLSPLFIPIAVTVVHAFGNWRGNRVARPVGSLGRFRAQPAAA
ncbi:hypothetical protein [Mycobacterium sp. JS623]|uniref:hypothetical protein n=1 Tax=Mycobacterium sp. JS623 TaxID=212767 RepID=UPI0012FBA88C|nr:hypothetical protein [Mycobacterium sp. JS623]